MRLWQDMIGAIVGKGGSNIMAIQDATGCFINTNKPQSGGGGRGGKGGSASVTIKGPAKVRVLRGVLWQAREWGLHGQPYIRTANNHKRSPPPPPPVGRAWKGGVWHKAWVSDCLPLAAPLGLSPLLILTLWGSGRVLVVSTEPPDDLSFWLLRGSAVPETGCCSCR